LNHFVFNLYGRNIVAAKFIVIIKPTMTLFYFHDIFRIYLSIIRSKRKKKTVK